MQPQAGSCSSHFEPNRGLSATPEPDSGLRPADQGPGRKPRAGQIKAGLHPVAGLAPRTQRAYPELAATQRTICSTQRRAHGQGCYGPEHLALPHPSTRAQRNSSHCSCSSQAQTGSDRTIPTTAVLRILSRREPFRVLPARLPPQVPTGPAPCNPEPNLRAYRSQAAVPQLSLSRADR